MRSDDRSHLDQLFARMHEVIRAIPRGRVATYGQVAELAGVPGGARIAAASLKAKRAERLPWQRVIGKASGRNGRIKILDPVGAAIQRQLLEDEGVDVGDKGMVDLGAYGWMPKPTTRPPKRARTKYDKTVTAGSSRAASPRRPLRSGSKRRA
ncbi:MAG TPA: MGMT family protein [Kofleriaceae bacterium]|nr:MGMT family protein [Kofleriaceae bacterium]